MLKNRASWHKSCKDKISNEKVERLRKRKIEDSTEFISEKYIRASLLKSTVSNCIFCNEPAGLDGLHRASTFELDFNVRNYAIELQDTQLLAKLSVGDMVAIEAQYHKKCLSALYRRGQ
ncbi:hypothetical protein DPMN_153966 [Dreissena polymorpha]|uniref:Uncharacterized protein n=1 Tax=Dreissena polymorpha TaxID=45954 RepID=A0A9D4FK41_DREPO|nr:hypothetical protein DPMN_153966 [Dreissena polymorpha]